jgi:hypothetical protein
MIEACLDEMEQALNVFRDQFQKFKEYMNHLETIPENKLTWKEKELLTKYGKKKI